MSNYEPADVKAVDTITALFKTVISTSGIILALLWGLLNDDQAGEARFFVQIASIVLIVAITFALLGL